MLYFSVLWRFCRYKSAVTGGCVHARFVRAFGTMLAWDLNVNLRPSGPSHAPCTQETNFVKTPMACFRNRIVQFSSEPKQIACENCRTLTQDYT